MKKIIIRSILFLVALLVIALGAAYYKLDTIVKKAVETVGPQITGTSVTLSSSLLSPFSGSGKLSGFRVGNPQGFKGDAFRLGSISVGVKKESLLSDVIVVNSIAIRNPELTLEGNLGGNNLSKLLQNIQKNTAGKGTEKPKDPNAKPAKSKKFVVKEIVISGIKLHLAAGALNQKAQQDIALPDIRLQNIGTAGKGVSAAELATQIITPLLNSALKEGANALAKQGMKQLEQKGSGQLQKALPGILK
jgi:hypothetical protein